MKTFITILMLVSILSISVYSAILYLDQQYSFSAVLTLIWVPSLAKVISTMDFMKSKQTVTAK